jgi:hypothetical protein
LRPEKTSVTAFCHKKYPWVRALLDRAFYSSDLQILHSKILSVGFLKEIVYSNNPRNLEDLKQNNEKRLLPALILKHLAKPHETHFFKVWMLVFEKVETF